jgi:hypothetical protein
MLKRLWQRMFKRKASTIAEHAALLAEARLQQEEVRRRLDLIELKLSVIARRAAEGSAAHESRQR